MYRFSADTGGVILPEVVWQKCVDCLQEELPSQQFNTWIRPLTAAAKGEELHLLAPNRFIKEWVDDKFLERISELVNELDPEGGYAVVVDIGSGTSLPTHSLVTRNGFSQAVGAPAMQPREANRPANVFPETAPGRTIPRAAVSSVASLCE